MTGKELITKLQELSEEEQNLQVCVYDSEYMDYDKITSLSIEDAYINKYVGDNDKAEPRIERSKYVNKAQPIKIIDLSTF
jgi:hypothetical protein